MYIYLLDPCTVVDDIRVHELEVAFQIHSSVPATPTLSKCSATLANTDKLIQHINLNLKFIPLLPISTMLSAKLIPPHLTNPPFEAYPSTRLSLSS